MTLLAALARLLALALLLPLAGLHAASHLLQLLAQPLDVVERILEALLSLLILRPLAVAESALGFADFVG